MRLLDALGVPASHRATVINHTLAWALLGVFSGGVVQQLGFIVRKTGGSPLDVVFVTAGPHAFALLTVLYAPLLERYPAGRIVAASRFLCAALFIAVLLVPSAPALAAVGVAALVLGKVGDTFYGRLLGELYPRELRGRLQSLPLFAQALALAAASVLAGWLLRSREGAFRWLLPLVAPAGMAAALLVSRLGAASSGGARVTVESSRPSGIGEAFAEVARDRPFLNWTLVYSGATIGFWLVYTSLPVFLASVLRLGYWENGVILAAFNALYCVGFLLWGRILDRIKSLPTMVVSWSLVGVGTLLTAFGQSYASAVAGQALSGLALAGNDIAWYPVVLEFAPPHRVDRYMGVYMTAVGARALLGGAAGALLMSGAADGSRSALLAAAAFMLLGSAAMLLLKRRAVAGPPREPAS